ncbi:MAG: protein translocase subunit SecD [bacterium]|nr:protein translocase subunit SecD [bacterium]
MKNIRIIAALLLIAGAAVGWFVYSSEMATGEEATSKFRLGLDLNGGSHLVYKADVSKIPAGDVNSAMQTLRDVIERRVNLFQVSEPIVQIEQGGSLAEKGGEHKLIVELPGVTDLNEAIKMIGQTPILEFKLVDEKIAEQIQSITASSTEEISTSTMMSLYSQLYIETGLTGSLLQKSQLTFNPTTYAPEVGIAFNDEGKNIFAKITKEHKGEMLAIFLDGAVISSPVIQTEIKDGKAQITGKFTVDEAKKLVRNLNYGALPVPVELLSTQTIGASLGNEATRAGMWAGIYAFIIIAFFLIVWYRLPGLLAVISLLVYVAINLALFKFIPVTLTAAGIAGFILSIGMAVDANILIFERMKEELKAGRTPEDAVKEGFARAWLSIRDSNTSSLITAAILYLFPSTSVIQGFALVFFIGVVVSMFTAITFSRTLLMAIGIKKNTGFNHFILSSGFIK